MNSVCTRNRLPCGALLAMLLSCPPLCAQEGSQPIDTTGFGGALYTSSSPFAMPEPQKIIPVRVMREFELGTELERFASTNSRLLERRETELSEAIWKVDGTTTVTPTAIVVRDAVRPNDRRLGARLDYDAKAVPATEAREEHSAHIVDIDELKQLEIALNVMIRALNQSEPSKGEAITFQYKSRSGFAVSLTLRQKQDGVAVNAAVDKVSGDSKEKARRMFEESSAMIHRLIQFLSSF